MYLKAIKTIFLPVLFMSFFICGNAQTNLNIDPKWDSYYDNNPSGIRQNFQSSDFIKVLKQVNFIPRRKEIRGNQQLLIKALLMFEFDVLRQMSITGDYYSRTRKHDDYFMLYNMTYQEISKNTWNRLCPYLLPIMNIDGTINIR